MVWDSFYKRMVFPRDKAAWQHEYERRLQLEAENPNEPLLPEEETDAKLVVPFKWQLEWFFRMFYVNSMPTYA